MTTIADLRTGYLNGYLQRAEADTKPWTVTECGQYLGDALKGLWPDLGLLTTGDVATDQSGQLYTVPGSIERVSRIDVVDSRGYYVDRVTNFRPVPAGQVVIRPVLADGYTLRFTGWKPFDVTGADLPVRLEGPVAMIAASIAYGAMAAGLTNWQRQQNLDTGRIVDHQQAAGMSSYWQARADRALANDPARVSLAPRAAHR